ncbi:hypothetical protein V5O48_006252 [Marasmius crinis-equi]|uniref:Fe2OG dioxygenase domain-containing protein n=1 Tax=Marasmius crinis-equi TaxID=585013 RepID=A0ABR3FK06_9AGAR
MADSESESVESAACLVDLLHSFHCGVRANLTSSCSSSFLDLNSNATANDFEGLCFEARFTQNTDCSSSLEGEDSKRDVEAELYKLNVYSEWVHCADQSSTSLHLEDKGSLFRPHKDTPRSERMFGSLLIVSSTPHTGGKLVLRHEGKKSTFDSGKLLSDAVDEIAFVAFFSDVEHEVLPVTSGHRITLT